MSLDSLLKKVVQEIGRELGHKNIQVKEVFIRYYAGLLILDPNWGIRKEVLENRHMIQNFVKYVTQKLDDQYNPDIITMKLQLYFSLSCEDKDEMIKNVKTHFLYKLVPLKKDIIEVKTVGAVDSKQMLKFCKKLIYYMTLQSGMGNPTHDNVYKEVEAAFRSILTDQDIRDYVENSEVDRENRLNDFTDLITGVRIFNRFCGRGGEGIQNIPKKIEKALTAIQFELQKSLLNVMQKVNVFTTILDKHHVPIKFNTCLYELVLVDLPEGITENDIDRIKKLLVLYRQYEIFIRELMSRVLKIENRVEEDNEKMKKIYEKLDHTIEYKVAVPAYQVFPLFMEEAKLWSRLQNEVILLNRYHDISTSLDIYTKQVNFPEYEHQDLVIEQLLGSHIPQTDVERLKESIVSPLVPPNNSEFKLITPDQFEKLENVEFQFLGFCAWYLVASDGCLLPGNPNIGLIQRDDKYYIFSSSLAMNTFNLDPKNFVNKALELFRRKPELICFFSVRDQLIRVANTEQLIPKEITVGVEKFEAECQTVEHLYSKHIVPCYKWNMWDLKRKAVLLANLSHCKTSSTQTEECAGLGPGATQTYAMRDQEVQTTRQNASNVPTPTQYIFGLRGRIDNKQIQLDLTESIKNHL